MGAGVIIGTTTAGTTVDGKDNAIYNRFIASSTGHVSYIRVYSMVSGNIKTAIYSDNSGEPGNKISGDDIGSAVTGGQWNDLPFVTADLVQGTAYWLAYNFSVNGVGSHYSSSGGARRYKVASYATWTWPASAGSGFISDTYRVAIAGWGIVMVYPSGINTSEAFGTLKANLKLIASGIASLEALGDLIVSIIWGIGIHAAVSQRRYKAAVFSTFTFPDPAGGGFSDSSDGYYMITGLAESGIRSLEAIGTPTLRFYLLPSGISSGEALGEPQLNFRLLMSAIASAEAFGTAKLVLYVLPSGIVTEELVGEPKVVKVVTPTGIATGEVFGIPQLNFIIFPAGTASAEAFGNMVVSKPLLYIQRYVIEIHNSAGALLAVLKNAYGISLEETINAPKFLTFLSPADEDKLSYVTRANEIWVRDVENDTILAKVRLQRSDDVR